MCGFLSILKIILKEITFENIYIYMEVKVRDIKKQLGIEGNEWKIESQVGMNKCKNCGVLRFFMEK